MRCDNVLHRELCQVACEPAHYFGQERENKEGEKRGGGRDFPALFSLCPPTPHNKNVMARRLFARGGMLG